MLLIRSIFLINIYYYEINFKYDFPYIYYLKIRSFLFLLSLLFSFINTNAISQLLLEFAVYYKRYNLLKQIIKKKNFLVIYNLLFIIYYLLFIIIYYLILLLLLIIPMV